MSKSKNDIAWNSLFEKFNIINQIEKNGSFEITSEQINDVRQARLMTKFDHKSQLPEIFAKNNLSILPTNRGGYSIGNYETFFDFNTNEVETVKIEFPNFLESLNFTDITSEATAINCAFVSKILNDFTNEIELFPTVNGRMSSSFFDYQINSKNGKKTIYVDRSQIEIDGGFEGSDSLNLIEAKNYISNDFLIRQLFYPYVLWKNKIQKKVKPIFLTYSNGIFHLREYEFANEKDYNSIFLRKEKKYTFSDGNLNLEVLSELLEKTETIPEPSIPFPQADSFERVINLCELLNQSEFLTKEMITANFDFDKRQTDYYSNAAKYLGLVDFNKDVHGNVGCYLTNNGKRIFSLNIIERQKEFIRIILTHQVFKKCLDFCLKNSEMPSKFEVIEMMKKSRLNNVKSPETFKRRSSTVISWTNWILNQIHE